MYFFAFYHLVIVRDQLIAVDSRTPFVLLIVQGVKTSDNFFPFHAFLRHRRKTIIVRVIIVRVIIVRVIIVRVIIVRVIIVRVIIVRVIIVRVIIVRVIIVRVIIVRVII